MPKMFMPAGQVCGPAAKKPKTVMLKTEHDPRAREKKIMPRLLAIKQAIYELGISRTALYELIEDGRLKTLKIGRRRLVPIEAIEELIAGLGK
jgi:excisionase family DNA binding protein